MIVVRDEAHMLALTDAFHSAAIDGKGWSVALDGLARATGSQTGELIGIGADAAVPFNILTNIDPGFEKAFAEAQCGDPRVNPRVKAGMQAPILKVLAESDFLTPDEHKHHPHYQDFARPWNVPFICLTTLERNKDCLIGLAVARTRKEGHIDSEQRRLFAAVAPYVRAAVRTQIALQGQGELVLCGALEGLSMPAFVCDRRGLVRRLTPAAEALVARGCGLQLKSGRLTASVPLDGAALSQAIDAAALEGGIARGPHVTTVSVRETERDLSPLVLDVIALPQRELEFNFEPRLLVAVRGVDGVDRRRAAVLQTVYGMTAAETDIALQLSEGKAAESIAQSRGVSVGTVRAQIKALLAKAGVRRQMELVARLSKF